MGLPWRKDIIEDTTSVSLLKMWQRHKLNEYKHIINNMNMIHGKMQLIKEYIVHNEYRFESNPEYLKELQDRLDYYEDIFFKLQILKRKKAALVKDLRKIDKKLSKMSEKQTRGSMSISADD